MWPYPKKVLYYYPIDNDAYYRFEATFQPLKEVNNNLLPHQSVLNLQFD